MLHAITLEGADIVAKSQLGKKTLENIPIALARLDAEPLVEMVSQILLDPIVVQQRVVDIDEENNRRKQCHSTVPIAAVVAAPARGIRTAAAPLNAQHYLSIGVSASTMNASSPCQPPMPG